MRAFQKGKGDRRGGSRLLRPEDVHAIKGKTRKPGGRNLMLWLPEGKKMGKPWTRGEGKGGTAGRRKRWRE